MTPKGFYKLLQQGEGLEVEFKESHFELSKTCFETNCAFLNRNGGHLLLGVKNNGKEQGVLESGANKMVNEIVTNANNLNKLNPQFYLSPEIIEYENKKIIYVYVPESSQVPRARILFLKKTMYSSVLYRWMAHYRTVIMLVIRVTNMYAIMQKKIKT